ncbi:hypothetical protein PENTCL1PPCAC_17676, partial [Pristionchus entomophagus]
SHWENCFPKEGSVHFILCCLFLLSNTDLLFYFIFPPATKNIPIIEKTSIDSLCFSLSILSVHLFYSLAMMDENFMTPLLPFIRDIMCTLPFQSTCYNNRLHAKNIF